MTDDTSHRMEVNQIELEAAFAVPALVANRFVVSRQSNIIRISFGERPPGSTADFYRVGVALTDDDAISLYKLVRDMVKPYEDFLASTPSEVQDGGK